MSYWEMILEAYREMDYAAKLAHQEAISLINQWRFDEAKKVGESRYGYYECAKTAIHML